ncbi:MAG: hypothetical protein AB8G96_03880 [Phycisphaerales bacterium]
MTLTPSPRSYGPIARLVWVLVAIAVAAGWVSPRAALAQERSEGTGQAGEAATGAPVRGFVYIEPFEIRAEYVIDVARSGLASSDPAAGGPIDAAARERLLAALRPQAEVACTLRSPDGPMDLSLDTLDFIVIDPVKGARLDDRPEIPWEDAIIGGVLATAREDFPASIDLEWRLFAADGGPVSIAMEVASGDDVAQDGLEVVPADASRTWVLPSIAPAPGLVSVAAVRTETVLMPWLVAGGLGVVGIAIGLMGLRAPAGERGGRLLAGVLAIAVGGGAYVGMGGGTRQAIPESEEARGVVEGLLRNVYHAFAHREERRIYDTLAESVQGDLRATLYLDIQRGLADEKDGGPRVKILEVSLVDCDVDRIAGRPGMRADAVWISGGDVSHWGHVHRRRNQYRGVLTIEPVDGVWKLTEVTILEEQRT